MAKPLVIILVTLAVHKAQVVVIQLDGVVLLEVVTVLLLVAARFKAVLVEVAVVL